MVMGVEGPSVIMGIEAPSAVMGVDGLPVLMGVEGPSVIMGIEGPSAVKGVSPETVAACITGAEALTLSPDATTCATEIAAGVSGAGAPAFPVGVSA